MNLSLLAAKVLKIRRNRQTMQESSVSVTAGTGDWHAFSDLASSTSSTLAWTVVPSRVKTAHNYAKELLAAFLALQT